MTTEEEQLLEEERLRREQESYPVARAPVYAGSPAADIDAANAAAPMQQSYAEPGQEARGFIAADVGPTGNVISGSYDSSEDDLRTLRAHEAAIRYKGMQTYRSLLQGGATPAEAYRLAGADLNFQNPAAAVRLQLAMQKSQPKPLETMTRDGRTFYRTPTGGWTPLSAAHVPEETKSAQKLREKDIDDLRRTIARDTILSHKPVSPAGIMPGTLSGTITEEEKMAAVNRATQARGRLNKLQTEYREGSSSPAPMPPSVSAPAPAAVTTKDPEGGFTIAKPGAAPMTHKPLTREEAAQFLKAAKGNRAEAEKMARDAGYSF